MSAAAAMDDKYYLTSERHDELKAELEYSKTEKRQEIAERLKQAKEFGDLSENAEYTEAREEQNNLEIRIMELEELLKRAVIIQKSSGRGDVVTVGSTVFVKKDGQPATYTIVGSNEARPEEGKISNESPIGRALLGRKVGDTAEAFTPGGTVKYQVTKIE